MKILAYISTFLLLLMSGQSIAQDSGAIYGKPQNMATGFQTPVTALGRDVVWFDNVVLVIIGLILALVVGIAIYIIIRFNQRANPEPAAFSHNTKLEITWTLVPIVILLFIGSISVPLLFRQQIIPQADINIKVTGYQWYWGYEYTDHNFAFESNMLGNAASITPDDVGVTPYKLDDAMRIKLRAAGYQDDEFLLATDNAVVVPVNKTVVMQVTGADVIHSWALPSFGVKQDGVPGRLAELWFNVEREGVYFGQCSELCGMFHTYMPITVRVVSQEEYDAWLLEAQDTFAAARPDDAGDDALYLASNR